MNIWSVHVCHSCPRSSHQIPGLSIVLDIPPSQLHLPTLHLCAAIKSHTSDSRSDTLAWMACCQLKHYRDCNFSTQRKPSSAHSPYWPTSSLYSLPSRPAKLTVFPFYSSFSLIPHIHSSSATSSSTISLRCWKPSPQLTEIKPWSTL